MIRPNLLVVLADQMRGQAMGFLGEEPVRTPAIDRFAAQSLVLTDAVASYPLCSPSRAMLMTGIYPHTNGVIANCTSESEPYGVELRAHDRCWSDVLKEEGYCLGYIGKWHLDSPRAPYVDCANNRGETKWNEWCAPVRRHGFDFWYAYGTYDEHTRPMYWRTDARRDQFHYVDQWGPEHEADLAIRYLRNRGGEYRDPSMPFGLVVATNPPHMPYELVPARYVEPYANVGIEELCGRPNIPPPGAPWGEYYRSSIRNYYAMITGVDRQFGRILESLDEEGLAGDTIVLFTSDHGNCLGIHNEISKNNFYEESLRVPFLIRWPDRIPPKRDDLLLSMADVAPTLLDLMGFASDIPGGVEGRSRASIFRGGDGPRPRSQLCMSIPAEHPAFGWRAVRTGEHTYAIRSMPGARDETFLFDNRDDPYQLRNVAGERHDLVRELREELYRWIEATGDPWGTRRAG